VHAPRNGKFTVTSLEKSLSKLFQFSRFFDGGRQYPQLKCTARYRALVRNAIHLSHLLHLDFKSLFNARMARNCGHGFWASANFDKQNGGFVIYKSWRGFLNLNLFDNNYIICRFRSNINYIWTIKQKKFRIEILPISCSIIQVHFIVYRRIIKYSKTWENL
jgi:hypothetical protein